MTDEIEDPIAQAEAILSEALKELDAVVTRIEDDKDSTVELQKRRVELEAELADVLRAIREIENKRYRIQIEKRDKERKVSEAQHFRDEAIREAELARTRKENFNNLIDECKNADYKWTHYAMRHQWEGALQMGHHQSAILGDDTGTGKTVTAIMAMDMVKAKKALVVTPSDVASDFFDAIVMFSPHRRVIFAGGANKTLREMIKTISKTMDEFVIVTNYEALWRSAEWLTDIEWDAIFYDEAHSWKNHKGTSFTRMQALKSNHHFPMTATSILNSPGDIWTSLNIIDPWTFDDKHEFLRMYCTTDEKGKWVFRTGGEKLMLERLGGRIIRRTLEECGINLPKQTISEYRIPVSAIPLKQAEIINQLANFATIALESGESATIDAMIALITRQRQAVVYPAGIVIKATEKDCEYNPDWKVGQILLEVPKDTPSVVLDHAEKRITDKIAQGHRVVVFSQFKTALTELETRLQFQGVKVCRYDGDTSRDERLKIKRDFIRPAKDMPARETYEYDVVLANYKTGGVGLTFTEATYMLCLDEEWNPAKNRQAWARIHRIGQTEETEVEIIRVEKSISMWMKTLNEHKYMIEQGLMTQVGTLKDSFKAYLEDAAIPTAGLLEHVEPVEATVTNRDDDLAQLRAKLLGESKDPVEEAKEADAYYEAELNGEHDSEEEITFDEDFLNLLNNIGDDDEA